MLVHASVLRARSPSLLGCIVAGHQFLSPFDPARSKCIWCRPSNAQVVVGLYNISDSSGWLLQPTDYASKRASVRLWTYLRTQTFSTWNFLSPVIQCYLLVDLVKDFVYETVVLKMLSGGTSPLERHMLRYMWVD